MINIKFHGHQHNGSNQRDFCKEQKEHKNHMILDSNSVVDPRAVVVEPLNSPVSDTAVTRSWGANDFSLWAQHRRVKFIKKGQELNFGLFQVAWIFARTY